MLPGSLDVINDPRLRLTHNRGVLSIGVGLLDRVLCTPLGILWPNHRHIRALLQSM